MTSTSETGHAKNVANFEDLISFCTPASDNVLQHSGGIPAPGAWMSGLC